MLLAAGDTFRAAAREQLAVWGERNGVDGDRAGGRRPGGGRVRRGRRRRGRAGIDVLLADTAGRLPTQLHLMEELTQGEARRSRKADADGAPHEVLLVLDAQHRPERAGAGEGLRRGARPHRAHRHQARRHGQGRRRWRRSPSERPGLPIRFIGVGEKLDDLQRFVAAEFVDALLPRTERRRQRGRRPPTAQRSAPAGLARRSVPGADAARRATHVPDRPDGRGAWRPSG
ncbi:MAG: hypothetical protein MZW92_69095 [Comamonadaceae bacterium]|nr:hypothetical protein [Comamonadaceae bacterium]